MTVAEAMLYFFKFLACYLCATKSPHVPSICGHQLVFSATRIIWSTSHLPWWITW